MATYTNFGLSTTLTYWFTRDASTIASATASSVDLLNNDGTHTLLSSAGNDFTFTNVGGVITLTGGTITTIARTNGAAVTYENVTGISYAATAFQARLPNSDLQGVANDIFGGTDTFTGSGINDFVKTFGGNDTVNGGAGFDTVSYLSGFMTGPVTITVGTTNNVGAPNVATASATAASNTIGTDTLNSVEGFIGTNLNDTYTAFGDFFSNGSTFNQFEGLGGNDTIAGNGNTRISFNSMSGPAGATLVWTNSLSNTNGSGSSTGTGIGTDTFSGVNSVFGSQFNDVFTATGASNAGYGANSGGFIFYGQGGNDLLTGGGTNVRWDFNFARYEFEGSGIAATLGTTNTAGAPTTDVGTVTGATAGTDTLHYIEGIRGTNFVDTFTAYADFRGIFGSYNDFEGMAGNDTITGNGNTRVSFGAATSGVTVTWAATPGNAFTGNGTATGDSSVGTDTFTGVNSARGSNFDDTFTATGAHGTFSFDGRGGDDTFNGGTFNFAAVDFDTAMYQRATSGITVMMDATSTVTGDSSVGTDTLVQVEGVRGSHFDDTYTATAAFLGSFGKLNVFSPGGGDDTITGNGATQLDYRIAGTALAAVTVNLNTGVAQSTAGGDLAQIGTDTFTGVNGVRGSQFNDTLIGSDGAQAELFRGEEGNDSIDGGLGSHNTASYSDSISGVVVNLATGSASDGWGGTDTLVRIQDVLGSEFADSITGDTNANILIGRNGDDSLFGAGGSDILIGDDTGVNALTNNAFGIFAEFDVGNDTLDGGAGADQMTGGKGNDIYIVDDAGDVVTESLNEGNDEIRTTLATFTLGANVEKLTRLGGADFVGTGNSLANTITGGIGNDTLDGGAGADQMSGSGGNDIYIVDDSGDVVTEQLNEGTDEVRTALASYTLTANVEKLTRIGGTAFAGTGNALANTIVGAGGADVLDGGAGADQLIGGANNDIYIVDNANDVVTELANEGTDEVRATAASYTLSANVENLTRLGGGDFTGIGNGLNNVIIGGTGNDYLIGLDGNDTLIDGSGLNTLQGGLGNDIYAVQSTQDTVFEFANEGVDQVQTFLETYQLSNNVENLTFVGSIAHVGIGNNLSNVLTGNIGNDTLDGGVGGSDTLVGAAGNDTYVIRNAGDVVVENANQGNDTVVTALGSYTLGANVENLTHTGSSSFTGIGTSVDNVMIGGTGDDYLIGLDGNDRLIDGSGFNTLQGGLGDDIYAVQLNSDTVFEFANEGTDEVQTFLSSYKLSANVEVLRFIGGAQHTGIGNELNNVIFGGTGDDYLIGLEGNDTLIDGSGVNTLQGGKGDDIYAVQSNADTVFEFANEGTDQVQTFLASYTLSNNVENLTFIGNISHEGTGNALNNVLTGAGGSDTFTGAGGSDTFNYRTVNPGVIDTITDFNADNANAAEHDHIDLAGRGLNFASLSLTSTNGGTLVAMQGGDAVFLQGVAIGTVDANDFFFV